MLALLREIVFIRLILPFFLGIITFIFLPYHPEKNIVFTGFVVVVIAVLGLHYLTTARKLLKYNWLSGVFMHLLFYLTGYLVCAQRTEIDHAHHFSKHIVKSSKLLLQVDEPLAETEKTYKTICKVIAVSDSNGLRKACGKVQVYFRKDSAALLNYGQRIWADSKFTELNAPKNPGEFNYKRFMGFRQVYHQAFLNRQDWELADSRGGNPVIAIVLGWRMQLLDVLRKAIKDDRSYSVAASLILGLREKMDDELMQAYSNTGTIHVLAVSGLHVAIMFKIFGLMFFFLDKSPRSKVTKAGIIILLIWLYALLTGLSPSVLRAAVMFTFITLGSATSRTSNIYNLIACSAFALLLYNPYYIMEVGFQLSYLAVLGIILLHSKVYPLFYSKVRAVDYVWALVAISIIAQFATFPLVLLNFHQFPMYFLLSNLVVLPAAEVVLWVGILLMLLFWIPGMDVVLGFCIEQLLRFMNAAVMSIETFPFALLQGISINTLQSWLIYIAFLSIVAYVYWKRNEFVFTALGCMVAVLGWNVIESVQQAHQRKLVVYSVSKSAAMDFISGTEHVFIADTGLIHDDKRMSFHIEPGWWMHGLDAAGADNRPLFQYPFVHRKNEYIRFMNKTIVMLSRLPEQKKGSEKLSVDYVILTGNVKVKLEELVKIYNFKLLIFDSSNHHSKVRAWTKDCAELGLTCYDVSKSGAYMEDF